MSLRDDILGLDDAKIIPLEVPEWSRTVHLRVLSGAERDRFESSCAADPKTGRKQVLNLRARFAVMVLCDEKGQRIFTDADAEALGKKSSSALSRIMEAAGKLNRFLEADVQELEGKSAGDQSGGSGTSSP